MWALYVGMIPSPHLHRFAAARAASPVACSPSDAGVIALADARGALLASLQLETPTTDLDFELEALCRSAIMPYEAAIYLPALSAEDRKSAIQDLAR